VNEMKGKWYGSRERCRRCGKRLVMEEWEKVGSMMKWKCKCGMVYCKKWWDLEFNVEKWFESRFGKKWKGIDEMVEEFEKIDENDYRMVEYEMIRFEDEMGWGMNSWLNSSIEEIVEELINVSREDVDYSKEWSKRRIRKLFRGMIKEGLVKKVYGRW